MSTKKNQISESSAFDLLPSDLQTLFLLVENIGAWEIENPNPEWVKTQKKMVLEILSQIKREKEGEGVTLKEMISRISRIMFVLIRVAIKSVQTNSRKEVA